MKDYYKILDISIIATQEEIKSQYRLLLHAWHPDKFSTSRQKEQAEEKIKEFNEAYSILGNVAKRQQYDSQSKNQEQYYDTRGSTGDKSKSSQNQDRSKADTKSDIKSREKNRSKKKKRSTLATKSMTSIQIAAIGVIFLVIAALIWLNRPTTEMPVDVQQPTAVLTQSQPESPAQPQVGGKQYSAAPPMTIDVTKKYTAIFKMAKGGEFVVQLYPDKAPITVNSFVFLTRDGYFNGVTFHRVLEGFMAQGGDPTGTGTGGPGYQFVNEDSDLTFDKPGIVAMANAGRDTNGSQFFITFAPTPNLNGGYTIFGQVISGMDVVNAITRRDPNQSPTFTGDVIESITITEE